MKASHSLDSIRTSFDEEHLVANAGLLLRATLMRRLGLEEPVGERVDLGDVPGHANVGLRDRRCWPPCWPGRSESAALPFSAPARQRRC